MSSIPPQSPIHSKLSKVQKIGLTDFKNLGRVAKGFNSQSKNNKLSSRWDQQNHSSILKEIEILPKSKLNVSRKMANKRIIPGLKKNDQIILMESSTFPAIYFKKSNYIFIQPLFVTSLNNVPKSLIIVELPQNCQELSHEDNRTPLIYQIVSNLLNQINFYIFNLMACQNMENNSYYVFFSDCQTLPFTKCCNAPVFIELQENGSGKILCNANTCKFPNLAQFLINFDDGKKLWPHVEYFTQASQKDRQLKNKISKMIINGRYKRQSLVDMVQDTSKQIVNLFYQSKKNIDNQIIQQTHTQEQLQTPYDQDTFVTGFGKGRNEGEENQEERQSDQEMDNQKIQFDEEILEEDSTNQNLDLLKMKLKYISKRQIDLPQKLTKSIAEDCKVFQHNFDIIRKIDEQILRNRNSRAMSKITFPQLMNQIRRGDQQKSRRNSHYRSFHL